MKNYYNLDYNEVLKELNTDINGLSKKEANIRLKKYGYNELPKKKKTSFFDIFLSELKDPIVIIMLFSSILSLLIGEKVDALVIFLIVLVDLILGTFQEFKANNISDSLQKLVKEKTKVLRDNKEIEIDSNEIVKGDIIFLESGDKVSGDVRLIETHNLTIDESILTGESIATLKSSEKIDLYNLNISDIQNMAFGGTTVVTGRAKAVVLKTGLDTEIGKIAKTIDDTKEEKTPLTIRIDKFSKQITFTILIIAILVFILLSLKDVSYDEIFLSVVALSVSAMPEGLPLALTMALTIASTRMSKKQVVAKKLSSVESLGSSTIIASDKTGTLTCNEQTAKKIILPNGQEYEIEGTGYNVQGKVIGNNISSAKELVTLGVINNEATFNEKEILGDSIDIAFKVLGKKLDIDTKNIKILETIPYESSNKYSAVFYEYNNENYVTIKGSLEKVISFCNKINNIKKMDTSVLEKQNTMLAKDGYRVIALANAKINKKDNYTEDDIKKLTFMGMVGFIDPVRKEVKQSIMQAKKAGIKVLMITGDHPLTAYKIAKELNIINNYDEVAIGDEIENYINLSEDEFDKFIVHKKVFARISPIQKLKIVESLKRQGEFVAVTGDGVNDAPALKSANLGISMGSGTDIAKETSKMIILDDNFKSIVQGIKEGRIAYSNIRKIAYFLISCGLAEVLFFLFSIMFDLPIPLLAIQLLWLNIVTDGLQDFALSFEKAEKDIMNKPPLNPKDSLFDKTLKNEIMVSGISIGILVFILWYFLVKIANFNIPVARAYIMTFMVFIQNIHAFNCRSEKNSIFSINIKSNPIFLLAIFGSILLQILIMKITVLSNILKVSTISYIDLFVLFILSTVILIIMESYKYLKYKVLKNE